MRLVPSQQLSPAASCFSFFFSANPFDIPYAAAYSPRVNHAAVRWWLTGKNMADRGRCSRDLRAELAGWVVPLLPRTFWSFPGGKGSSLNRVLITRGLFFEISNRLPSFRAPHSALQRSVSFVSIRG